ncbi:metalloregulator ArsR/SmtB family transcription factor [Komagataeibacter nataicola]|uniref:ArsR/SmtB family transcription factor n=1 Tax=Komagataeibacter nataicola TaxID=265960 RepID=UPI0028A89879|nr:metalloregulator ArsR/SmtB family transcription factor [Komagataeibacter nataicola]WNM07930.1 metalloregulator ArsR/SmtB family transcription factor [Komagataeibacter nataicola]
MQRLRLLAQPQRLMVLACLLEGEKSVGQIECETGIGQPTLSQQLAELRRAEIVITRKEARQVIYSIKDSMEEMRVRLICAVCDPDFDMERLAGLVRRGRRPQARQRMRRRPALPVYIWNRDGAVQNNLLTETIKVFPECRLCSKWRHFPKRSDESISQKTSI